MNDDSNNAIFYKKFIEGLFENLRLFGNLDLSTLKNNSIAALKTSLLEEGADINSQTSDTGNAVLHLIAICYNNCFSPSIKETLRQLLEYGADINITNKLGDTPKDIADRSYECLEFAQILSDLGAKNGVGEAQKEGAQYAEGPSISSQGQGFFTPPKDSSRDSENKATPQIPSLRSHLS